MDRRQFLISGAAGLATLVGATKLGDHPIRDSASSRAEELFGRGYEVDFTKLPLIYLKNENAIYTPTSEEIQLYSQQVSKHPEVKGKQILQTKFDGAISGLMMHVESDPVYAKRYITQAKIAIQHAQKYFGFPELQNIPLDYKVPKSAKDLVIHDKPLTIHMVAKLVERKSLGFYTTIKGQKDSILVSVNGDLQLNGKYLTDAGIVADKGEVFLTPIKKSAIFCGTTGSLEARITTPVLEFIHSQFKEHFYAGFSKQFQTGHKAPIDLFINGHKKSQKREEQFVHALGVLWFEQYNKDKTLGFSEKELKEHHTKSEASDQDYKGMTIFAGYIRKIGIQEARKQYIENPDKLFEVVEGN